MFDQNGDGVITTEEMVTAMRGLGHNPTRKEVSEMLGLNPADGRYIFKTKVCRTQRFVGFEMIFHRQFFEYRKEWHQRVFAKCDRNILL